MARTRNPARLERILAAGTEAFLRASYSRVGMAEVARLAKMAPGTLYLYVENKEALFMAVLCRAILGDASVSADRLPIRAQSRQAILDFLRDWYRREARLELPKRVVGVAPVAGIREELRAMLSGLYDLVARSRVAVRIIERSAADWPALYELHFRTMRRTLLADLGRYLSEQEAEGTLRSLPDAATAARVILENVAWFAMHRHYAPDSGTISDAAARETVLTLLVHALAKEPSHD